MEFEYEFSLGNRSDLTGREIKLGEPVIYFKGMIYKIDEIEEFINIFKEEDFHPYKFKKIRKHELCFKCRKTSDYKFIEKDNQKNNFCVCNNCIPKITERAVNFKKNVKERLFYWDSSGINIYDYSFSDANFVNCITGDVIKEGRILTIALSYKKDYLATEIKNIKDLRYRLEDKRESSEYNYYRHNRNRKSPTSVCDMCGNWLQEDRTSPLCKECEQELSKNIDVLLDNHAEEILSGLI